MNRRFGPRTSVIMAVILNVGGAMIALGQQQPSTQADARSSVAEARQQVAAALSNPGQEALNVIRQHIKVAQRLPDAEAVEELRWLGDTVLQQYANAEYAGLRFESIRLVLLRLQGKGLTGARDRANGLAQKLTLAILDHPEDLTVGQEHYLATSGFSVYDEQGEQLSAADWREQRRRLLNAWLHAWRRIEAEIDPEFDEHKARWATMEFPECATMGWDTQPEMIKDPKQRQLYEQARAERERERVYCNRQNRLRYLEASFPRHATRQIVSAYSTPPEDDEQLAKLLDEYEISEEWQERIQEGLEKQRQRRP